MLPVALQPNETTAGLEFTTVSKFVPNPPKAAHVDSLAKERRRRLLELTKQAFPDGKVPDPLSLTLNASSRDVATSKFPFTFTPRIVVTSATDTSDHPPQSVSEDASAGAPSE
jgi:hypothetical protein